MARLNRKDEHIYYRMLKKPGRSDFSDINFVHNCLPDLNLNDVSLNTAYLGRTFRSPLFINAITGGTRMALKINAALAEIARKSMLPMAVGSQMVALEDNISEASFKIVRRINPHGIIWANIGSYADPDMVRRAVKMIRADGVQIHLNVSQEAVMSDGDCQFKGMINRIRQIVKSIDVPVIVKEVGFGIAKEQAGILAEYGVSAIDVGGKGGTNFLDIERKRSGSKISGGLLSWGIPTAISLLEVAAAARGKVDLFASGGLNAPIDIAKALALGANAVGLAGVPVYLLLNYGRAALENYIKTTEKELQLIMFMTGVASLRDLQRVPLVLSGLTAEWMQRRGLDPSGYADRSENQNLTGDLR
jgi:isopentenyl-diphosphate Delta-isomerase